ncbi:HNH endonuclease signature motif containing protein [Thiohalophilus sp.]|uniref:HNH endonuclease n=1 Tax=Thiohalophilus sp. TaxID=3028392 RepID=UPI002ACD6A4A|nr:HNH endonuclease signature motif containing protein [Thiohalophilus sp.]MDZ7803163.1 HNH endonuclease signature motif containing protein [Thiohalophilus sp.]
MGNSVNKFGLKRYIPSEIRAKIRKDSGFGCVICGCVLIDYEHIDPEFTNAKEHNPDNMTLLCINCHGRVSRKIISKEEVWKAKKDPKGLQDGFVHDLLFVDTEEMNIRIGSLETKNTNIILTLYGKPIIWFEPPYIEGEPSKLCSIFHNDTGKVISYVNRNQFIAYTDSQDIKSESTELAITSESIKCLVMNREGGEILYISRMNGRYLDAAVSIDNNEAVTLKIGERSITLSDVEMEACGSAIYMGNPPSMVKYKKVFLAVMMACRNNTIHITNLKERKVGAIFGEEIFNNNYELVGFIRGSKVFSITNEYIGNLIDSKIAYKDDCYENGEPIYISRENREFKNRNPHIGYDISFRLFGSQ